MTAYGRADKVTPFGRFLLEIHSVNRKTLDLNIYLPRDYLCFDTEIRKWIASHVERGQVTLRLTLQNEGLGEALFQTQLRQLKGLKDNWDKLACGIGLDPKQAVSLEFLVGQMSTSSSGMQEEDVEEIKRELQELILSGLRELKTFKEKEGLSLASDIKLRLKLLEDAVNSIETLKDEPLERYRQKITERLQGIYPVEREAQERLIKEVALLAEKLDITEEIVRLRSHFQQVYSHLQEKGKPVGRLLEFLAQEMHREINTLGSKSADTQISSLVVGMKGELEKIREQVQNIE